MIPYFLLATVTTALIAVAERFRGSPALASSSGAPQKPPAHGGQSTRTYWAIAGLALVLLVGFSAVRVNIGTDYALYAKIFANLSGGDWAPQLASSPHEPGFTLLSLLTRMVTDSPRLLFAIAAVLTIVPTFLALQERSTDFTFAICLYFLLSFYVLPFNIVRQGIAIALNFYSLKYLDNRRYLFVLFNLLAASFHITALVAAVIQYVARNWRPSNVLFISVIGVSLLALAVTQLPLTEEILGQINPRYGVYIAEARSSFGAVGLGTLGVLLFRVATIAYSRSMPTSREDARYQTFLMLGLFFVIVGMVVNPLSRIEFYFSICALLLLPNQLAAKRARWPERLLVILAALVYFTATLYFFNGLLPYQTFLL